MAVAYSKLVVHHNYMYTVQQTFAGPRRRRRLSRLVVSLTIVAQISISPLSDLVVHVTGCVQAEEGRPGKVRRPSREVAEARLKLCTLLISICCIVRLNGLEKTCMSAHRQGHHQTCGYLRDAVPDVDRIRLGLARTLTESRADDSRGDV